MLRLPHPIPYQGSKRSLAPTIGRYVPADIGTWYEPFAGSAAMALWVARHRKPRRIVLGDSLAPMMQLWTAILADPRGTAARYAEVWTGQEIGDAPYLNRVRERFNENRDPVDLLYLLCRCVKNAVRFNAKGNFTQSVDKRRLGMRPDKMRAAIAGASELLKGKTEVRAGDWLETLADAGRADFSYMDPPVFRNLHGQGQAVCRMDVSGKARRRAAILERSRRPLRALVRWHVRRQGLRSAIARRSRDDAPASPCGPVQPGDLEWRNGRDGGKPPLIASFGRASVGWTAPAAQPGKASRVDRLDLASQTLQVFDHRHVLALGPFL